MTYWFRRMLIGAARLIVVNVKVEIPDRVSTSWTVKVWPPFTVMQVWPGKLHGGPVLVGVGVEPAGKVAISSWFGATSPTKTETLVMKAVMGDFIELSVPHFDPSPPSAAQTPHPPAPHGGLPETLDAVKPTYWLTAKVRPGRRIRMSRKRTKERGTRSLIFESSGFLLSLQ